MNRIVISWRAEPFTCQYRGEQQSGCLEIFQGDELLLKEPVDSLRNAHQRARELCDQLMWRQAKGA
jgi:hypothetical protein